MGSIYSSYLRASAGKARSLRDDVSKHIPDDNNMNGDGVVDIFSEHDAWYFVYCRDQFKTVFLSELSTLPSFLVSDKGGYETNTLIDAGERLFPASLRLKAPDAYDDAREVGKAPAFELATACGFHTFRVTEAVLKRYYDHVSNGAPRPKLLTIGSLAKEMEVNGCGDEKIIHSLAQLARLHRNPLIHPEVQLDIEGAIATLGIARSVVGLMLKALPEAPVTTDNSSKVAS